MAEQQKKTSQTGHGQQPPQASSPGGGAVAGGAAGGGSGDCPWEERQWSEPLPLEEAVEKSPVLVMLEDGSRGAVESLSFSQGDVMALEGEIRVKDRRLVLAHFTTEMEGEDGEKAEEQSLYRSLLSIPWEHLPEVDVKVCLDSGGVAYSNFVSTHFPQCNWREQKEELLDDMDDDDYYNINEITPKPKRPPPTTLQSHKIRRPPPPPPNKMSTSLSSPPPPPPRPHKLSPGGDDARKDTKVQSATGGAPPPRPPRKKGGTSPSRLEFTNKTETLFPSERQEKEDTTRALDKTEPLFPSELAKQEASEQPVYMAVLDDDDDDDDSYEIYIDVKEKRKQSPITEPKRPKQQQTENWTLSAKTTPVKPTLRVHPVTSQPVTSKPTSPAMRPRMTCPVTSSQKEQIDDEDEEEEAEINYELPKGSGLQVPEMTCRQLCARLKLCGMNDLASACESHRLEGAFFTTIPEDDFRKPPFSLNDFDINIKLKQVNSGWIPK